MPAELAAAIESCLAVDPGARPGVMELSRVLDRFVESRLEARSGARVA